jgi:hypothetical protein
VKIFPDSLTDWFRYGFVTCITACIGLVLNCLILQGIRRLPELYIERAAMALQISLALLFVVSLALLPLNRRLALVGIIASVIIFGLYPLLTQIKIE